MVNTDAKVKIVHRSIDWPFLLWHIYNRLNTSDWTTIDEQEWYPPYTMPWESLLETYFPAETEWKEKPL